jgi:hypothetical protein
MGLFSKSRVADPPGERSFSRQWIARTNDQPRKTELALAVLNQMRADPLCSPDAFGSQVGPDDLGGPLALFGELLGRERSLTAAVTRDLALVYQSCGGLGIYRDRALSSVGLSNGSTSAAPAAASLADTAMAIAEHFEEPGPTVRSQKPYEWMFLAQAEPDGHRQVAQIACWLAIVLNRLYVTGTFEGQLPLFSPMFATPESMDEPGWYPNPLNAGDTSNGEAEIERYWDVADWTSRVRVRRGRRWEEVELSMFRPMSN